MVNARVGDWVLIHDDAEQNDRRIPSYMPVKVIEVDDSLISIERPFFGACGAYWHDEYDVVEPWEHYQMQGGENIKIEGNYIVGDPPVGTQPGWIATTETNPNVSIPATEPDMVNLPPHYKLVGDIEVIDVIEALAKDDHWYACAIKYLLRAKKKGKLVEDLGKCKFYIDRMLRDAESEAK
jgi:hypothetical protein